jgi:lysophospholipase L1-like esterase
MTDLPTTPPDRPGSTPARSPVPGARATMPAGRVLIVMVVCLLTWGLIYAPNLKRSSEAQPLGTRRTVSLWLLNPIATISNVLQLTKVTDGISNALGKDPDAAPGGAFVPDPDPIPSGGPGSGSPKPSKPPVKTEPMRTPTPANKLRVAVVGDSLAAGLGVFLERVLRPTVTRVTKQGRISTGLAREDYFDWPAAMRQIMDAYDPDLVVVMTGVNDNQGLQSPGGQLETPIGTYDWPVAYEQRVEDFARIAVDGGAHVVWVGMPIVADRDRWNLFQRQNEIFKRVASRTPNMAYVDVWDRFAQPDGGYSAFFRDDGRVELIREADGIHFNGAGYEMVARAAIQAAVDDFDLSTKVEQDD